MANINIQIDDLLKKEAESVFEKIGLSAEIAINLFYKQVVRTNSIPFSLIADIPNEKTMKAIEEGRKIANNGKHGGFTDMDSLKRALEK